MLANTREEMAEQLRQLITENEWKYNEETDDENQNVIFSLGFELDSAIGNVDITVTIDEDSVSVVGRPSVNAEKQMAAAGEFIHSMNWKIMRTVYLLMNYEDGDLISYVELPFRAIEDKEELEFYTCNAPHYYFGLIGDSLLKVLLGSMTPKEAVEEVLEKRKKIAEEDEKEEN